MTEPIQATKPKRIPLTHRQQQIATFIRTWVDLFGDSPTYQEIARRFNISGPTVWEHIHAMARRGALTFTPCLSRSIVLAPGVGTEAEQDARDAAEAEDVEKELAEDYG